MIKGLVSVVIPVYNSASTIVECLESVIRQTYGHLEIIVIDDGSKDDLVKVLEPYLDKIQYIFQENKGASSARNNGITISSGDFLAFIDADDLWNGDTIEKQVKVFLDDDQIGLVHCNLVKQLPNGEISEYHYKNLDSETEYSINSKTEVFLRPYFGTPTVMVRKKFLELSGEFDESLKTAEDLDLFLRLSEVCKTALLNKVLVTVRVQDGGLRDNTQNYEHNIKVIKMYLARNPGFEKENNNLVCQSLSRIHSSYGEELLMQRLIPEAREEFKKSLNYLVNINAIILVIKSYFIHMFEFIKR